MALTVNTVSATGRRLFAAGKIADAVIISLPDDVHYQPCMKALSMGYHILLENRLLLLAANARTYAILP